MMSATLEQVFKKESYLSVREKALVAHCLIASLDTEQDEDIDSAWADLAEKRFFELVSGKVKAISWDEIKQRLQS
jgi:putative addiction module component (TIGR02574 family)